MSSKAKCRECGVVSENEIGVTIWFCCREHEKIYWGRIEDETHKKNPDKTN